MMFPAITPMVLLYNKIISNKSSGDQTLTVQQEPKPASSVLSFRVILFVGSYLLVWALTGIALLLGWSVVMNSTIMSPGSTHFLPAIYGSLLIIAGAYQFTPLKTTCVGYCESPMGFFMRRWKDGTYGAVKMGTWHGLYCLGCCWSYFLLMVALGWMNLLWMGLFAGIIFGEKIWRKGIWVARAAGVGLVVTGILVMTGLLPYLIPSASSMNMTPSSNPENSMKSMEANNVQKPTSMPNPMSQSQMQNSTAPSTPLPPSNIGQNANSSDMSGMKM